MAEAASEVLDLSHRRAPSGHALGKLAIQQEAQALAHQPESLESLTNNSQPHVPSARKLTVEEEHKGTRHGIIAENVTSQSRHRICELAIDHPAQTLAQLLEELRALDCHLEPRAEAARQTAVEHVSEALMHRLALRLQLLNHQLPGTQTLRQLAVHHVEKALAHDSRALQRARPAVEAERQLAIHHPAQPLAKLEQKRRTLLEHLHPGTPAARQAAVEEVPQALAHRLALRLEHLPRLVPRHPAARELAVEKVEQGL